MASLAELVAEGFALARSGFHGPIVLEALDDEGGVLWSAWHSTQLSFESRIIELISEVANRPDANHERRVY